jgi:3-hydroxybutyryl-CoA dehydrogenase
LKNGELTKAAIFGSGLMGSGIAQTFAIAGLEVTVLSVEDSPEQVCSKIRRNLDFLLENGALESEEQIEAAMRRIIVTSDKIEAVQGQAFIIECIPEVLELKQELFRELDAMCPPETILATNTSVMSINEIGRHTLHKHRVVGTHFWNPPFLIPLVEVVRADHTSEEVVERTMQILRSIGKRPVKVNRDVPGFVANRLQHALWREALSIVENGIADAATVDECIRYSFGLRLPVLAPLENMDMVGTDLTLNIHQYLFKYLENSSEPSALLRDKVQKQELGFKTGKGFFDWDNETIEASQKKLMKHLIASLKN